jgi:hypothetical protein
MRRLVSVLFKDALLVVAWESADFTLMCGFWTPSSDSHAPLDFFD